MFVTKDSGERETYETGARRDVRVGKGRYDLLPWYSIHRLAQLYERGAEKYGDHNWERGIPLDRFLDSALRHTFQLLAGDTDEDHAAGAVFNLMGYMHTEEQIRLGNLPRSLGRYYDRDSQPDEKPDSNDTGDANLESDPYLSLVGDATF